MWWHAGLASVLCLAGTALALAALAWQQRAGQHLQTAIQQARSQLVSWDVAQSGEPALAAAVTSTDPAQWPARAEADEIVRQAGEAALVHGIALRALSVSHQLASTQVWGRVVMDVSASGSYEALKAWQAVMQQRFGALVVQSLRLQDNDGRAPGSVESMGTLDAQAVWVLHVRD